LELTGAAPTGAALPLGSFADPKGGYSAEAAGGDRWSDLVVRRSPTLPLFERLPAFVSKLRGDPLMNSRVREWREEEKPAISEHIHNFLGHMLPLCRVSGCGKIVGTGIELVRGSVE
jgi:hypothetical protein